MRIFPRTIVFVCLIALSVTSSAAQETIPEDMTPFVRLGHQVNVSVYKNPILEPKTNKILHHGELLRKSIQEMPVGSGTIVSPDGLILTNNHVYQMSDYVRYNQEYDMLVVAKPTRKEMLVYVLSDNDPLKRPKLLYLAEPVAFDESHDTALLKIVSNQRGKAIDKNDFSYTEMGNPFGMRLNEELTIIGYPDKGGDTVTITGGRFLGYYLNRNIYGLDGFIKTNAAMAPGNSGGSALNKKVLIGVPTAVTLPSAPGTDLGYIHPVTWALKVFTIAAQKHGYLSPDIPVNWLVNDYNTDTTLANLFLCGKILSANANTPVSAEVIVSRNDRSFLEISKLHQEVYLAQKVILARNLKAAGQSDADIAKQFKTSEEEIKRILSIDFEKRAGYQDVAKYLDGEFFYKFTYSDADGFFILDIPRNRKVKIYISKQGFRPWSDEISLDDRTFISLDTIKLYQY